MRKKGLHKAKLIVTIESDKNKGIIKTVSVYDNRTQSYWEPEQIKERGICNFLNLADVKESLNWNLNGDEAKYQFGWLGKSRNKIFTGVAYIFQ